MLSNSIEPLVDNLPNGSIDWNEISEFIVDMLNPKNRTNKGWKIISDNQMTSHLQENSVIVLNLLHNQLYDFFYKQHGDRFEVWNSMEKFVHTNYSDLSDEALSLVISTYHRDDR